MVRDYEPAAFERKWQERWLASGIWKAEADPARPKFFLMFAYPGVSGYLHVGHMRGYTYSDVIARYKRMTGFNVLFPVGAHPTGNVAIAFARKIERGSEAHIALLRENGCPDDEIERLKDPAHVVRFFSRIYVEEYWKKFGFLSDWRRFMTTVDPGYNRFIDWQFRKLHERGLLVQKPYFGTACLECGPVAVDASETDISKGGNAEKLEWTLLKFRMGEGFVVAATLRPETVFGQTNFWANPDVEYVKARIDGETWVISRQGAEKLSFQKGSVEIVGTIPGKELIGRMVKAPVIDRDIPILPSSFTDPDYGTGLVTSVPSDAPYDWVALRDLAADPETCARHGLDCAEIAAIEPIPIIASKGWGPNPAVEICEKMGIRDQKDPRLEEATKEIYKAGFHTGRMRENCGRFAGKPVIVAKDEMRAMMLEMGVADTMYDLSEPVVCRCGGKVIVKQIPDQWFIDYGLPAAKDAAKAAVEGMTILPQEYRDNLPGVLDWFKERACARLGNWLGTRFPFDPRWTIEPIADSTLYSAYYIVSLHVADGRLAPEQMTESFFDYAFLGRGDAGAVSAETGIPLDVLERVRADFLYWYPLDINLGGKEHQTVHFPVFMMNHAAIMPGLMPRGIFVNWWVQGKSGKMSKSKGGAEPIPNAARAYTVDGLRLYYCHVASPHVDIEWDEAAVNNSRKSVERAWHFTQELLEAGTGEPGPMDPWLGSRVHRHLVRAGLMMEENKLREAANVVYFDMVNDLRWYARRGGGNRQLLRKAVDAWVRTMAPFTPHMAEELWEAMGGEGLVSSAEYPAGEGFAPDSAAEAAEELVEGLLDDISGILKMTGMTPRRIMLYTAHPWKYEVQRRMALDGWDMGAVMKHAQTVPEMRNHSKEMGAFASGMMKKIKQFGPAGVPVPTLDDEVATLRSAAGFLEREFGCDVLVLIGDEPGFADPKNKRAVASPGKPGIHVE